MHDLKQISGSHASSKESDSLYKSCKESLNETGLKDGLCKAAITSTLMEASFLMSDINLPSTVPEDSYAKGQYDTVKKIQKRLCIKLNAEDIKKIAKGYIEWREEEKNAPSQIEEYSLALYIFKKNSCKE